MTPWPTYVSTWALSAFALPSMKTVPLTVRTRVVASHDSWPVPVVQEYELEGVRLKTLVTLLLRVVSLSKTGTLPLDDRQPARGPGWAALYQRSQSALGGVRPG